MKLLYADIAVKTGIPSIAKTYTYKVPDELCEIALPGKYCEVPFGKKVLPGVIFSLHTNVPEFKVKDILKISPLTPIISTQGLELAKWISSTYLANLYESVSTMLPTSDKKVISKIKIDTNIENPKVLTPKQKEIVDKIIQMSNNSGNKKMLLHGVTGSGKTEIYMQCANKILEEGKQALFLVPEIALTPQLIERFSNRFGTHRVAVVHSMISKPAKNSEWKLIQSGQKDIIIGSRSAIMSPFKNLGIIIIDECHEQSYKQDRPPRYNTIEVAEYLSERNNIPLLLGSATPLIEQYYKAKIGKYLLLELNERISGLIPETIVVNLKEDKTTSRMITNSTLSSILTVIKNNNQCVIYFNRRGLSSSLLCSKCGNSILCPKCQMPYSLHKKLNKTLLACHYCFSTAAPPLN